MPMRTLSTLLMIGLLLTAAPQAQNTSAPAAPPNSPIFVFAQPFWLNLHHFLYVLGRAEAKLPDAQRRAVVDAPNDQTRGLATLADADRAAWREAVTRYAQTFSKQDTVFDAPLVAITRSLAAAGDDASLTGHAINADVAAILERVAPIYRKAWWPAHQRANAARIAALQASLDKFGPQVLAFMTRAYKEPWPSSGYPVNISAYSNWAGAYSTTNQLLVMSSLDTGSEGLLGLEIVFHEATHQWDDAIFARLRSAAERQNVARIPGGLTHAMIFYAAGEAVRAAAPSHTPYAVVNNMWAQGSFVPFKPALDAAWRPYLAGTGTLDDALDGIMRRIQ